MLFDKANSLTSLEAPTTSCEANMACYNVSQETGIMTHGQYCGGEQYHHQTLLEALHIQFARGSQHPL